MLSSTHYRFYFSGVDVNEMYWGFEFTPVMQDVQITVDGVYYLTEYYGTEGTPVNRVDDDFAIIYSSSSSVDGSDHYVTDLHWCYGEIAFVSSCTNSIHKTYTMRSGGWPDPAFSFQTHWNPDWPTTSSQSYVFDVYIGAVCSEYGTPGPPGTPVVSYCASVSPLDSGFGWDLFVDDGSPNCDMGWDAFDVLDYHVPTVQICLQPVRFGVIKLFSQSYEVGIFALAVAAAFFWRFWRTI